MDRLSTKGQMIDQIDLRGVPHSGFDRSNHNYGTGKLGVIIPTRLDEVYPGDRIKGRPQDVTNFEPLAAPLMGSMVLKQESFFVPYIQLWRHAYKFFTGKNGFDENMPSISPFAIFSVFNANIHEYIWGANSEAVSIHWSFGRLAAVLNEFRLIPISDATSFSSISGHSLQELFNIIANDIELKVFSPIYSPRKMLDLVVPCLDNLKRFAKSNQLKEMSDTLEEEYTLDSKSQILTDVAKLLGSFAKDIFVFFHGASSIFDYLGWPVVTDFSVPDDYSHFENTPNDIFEYWYLSRCTGDSNALISLNSDLSARFSSVPLVFNPFKAYYLIWYWNYRDQLLETDILDPDEDEFLGSTITDNVILYCCMLRRRCWFKDTFTTALTNTGSGNMLVPVASLDEDCSFTYYDDDDNLINTTDFSAAFNAGATICRIYSSGIDYEVPMNYIRGSFAGSYGTSTESNSSFISLDLFDRVQRLREYVQKRLILGYEVDDVVYSSFMVRMSNVRIHIPEILSQGRDAVQINTIVNNTSTSEQIAGDRTATAFVHGSMSEMNYFSEEWGLYLQFKTIMPIQSYAGGMQRLYLKTHPLDYMWPEFATMGMDAVYNCELAALGTRLTDEQGLQVFGYQGRYYDLKSRMDEEHGRLLTDLNYLTFSREWDKDNPPKLNYMFVHCFPRLDGFVVDSPLEDVFRYDCYNAQAWERRLPVPSEIVG